MNENTKTNKNLFTLFKTTFLLSAFTVGGGYVIVPLMRKKFVDELQWLEEEEMLDLIAISQSSPGVIAINASIIIGYRMFGFIGALVSTLGTVLPPLITLSIISYFYEAFKGNDLIQILLKCMSYGVVAVIFDVVLNMFSNVLKTKRYLYIIIFILAFVLAAVFKLNVAIIVLLSALVGIIDSLLKKQAKGDLK